MTALYNEIDPYAAQWLRNLIDAGHIAPGAVDERSIEDLDPEYVGRFTQVHFFAGIGVWSLALRRAGWADDRRVWTGSCPCQPFSAAGKGAGFADERHLWPAFHYLVQQCRPPVVIGEQVASSDAGPWLDLVHTDLEALGYAFGAVPFPSAGVGAPHIRDRLYWVADAGRERRDGIDARLRGRGPRQDRTETDRRCNAVRAGRFLSTRELAEIPYAGAYVDPGRLADAASQRLPSGARIASSRDGAGQPERPCMPGGLGYADSIDARRHGGDGVGAKTPGSSGGPLDGHLRDSADLASRTRYPGPTNGLWRDADWLGCRDGKWRPVEPGTFPLVDGAASRVVYTCAVCETETVKCHESLRTVRNFSQRYAGLRTSAVLLNEVLRAVDNGHPLNSSAGTLPSPVQVCREEVRAMRERESCGTSSSGRQRYEQLAGEYREALSKMSRCGASTVQPANADLQGLRHQILSSEVEEQYLFCPVCAGMGSHKRSETLDGSRVGRLRGYGNAINAEAARIFIESVM